MNVTYCDLKDFEQAFRLFYGYISVLVCIFGSLTNILNICVLTTKQMRCPVNLILTGLAVADLLVMLEYISFIFVANDNRKFASHYTYGLAVFIIFHALFTQAFHFISCCLTVILAVWRYIAVKFPMNNNKWCSDHRTRITVFFTYLLCPVVCTPLFFSLRITSQTVPTNITTGRILPKFAPNASNVTIYLLSEAGNVSKLISFYVYGVVIKLVPCVLLTVLSCLLIVELLKAKKRREGLLDSAGKRNARHLEKEKQADRTTKMLLFVLLLFLLVEFPQAIFGLLNHIVGSVFRKQCYQPLGEVLDVFTLITSSINFVLYCIMSKKFRTVFKEIFFPYIPFLGPGSKYEWTSLQTLKTYV